MGLEDDLAARYPSLRRPTGQGEAGRLVGEALNLFAEGARVLTKHGVTTRVLKQRKPPPEGFFLRLVTNSGPQPVAEGWELSFKFWISTDGRPWLTTPYIEGNQSNPITYYEQVPLDVDAWTASFAREGEQTFVACSDLIFSKRCRTDGEPELFMEHMNWGNTHHLSGPLKEMFTALIANLLAYGEG